MTNQVYIEGTGSGGTQNRYMVGTGGIAVTGNAFSITIDGSGVAGGIPLTAAVLTADDETDTLVNSVRLLGTVPEGVPDTSYAILPTSQIVSGDVGGSLAIGHNTQAGNNGTGLSTAIGTNSIATGNISLACGANSLASGENNIAICCYVQGNNNVGVSASIGSNASSSVGVGVFASVAGSDNIVLGGGASDYVHGSGGDSNYEHVCSLAADVANGALGYGTSKHLIRVDQFWARQDTGPTIAAGAGAGSGPTVSVTGTDLGLHITVTTGSSPSGSGATIATVTFASPYPVAPIPFPTPGNANAAALSGNTAVFATTTASTLVLTSGSSALEADTEYVFNILTIGAEF
jgi:trimeric autotransporter adhesin